MGVHEEGGSVGIITREPSVMNDGSSSLPAEFSFPQPSSAPSTSSSSFPRSPPLFRAPPSCLSAPRPRSRLSIYTTSALSPAYQPSPSPGSARMLFLLECDCGAYNSDLARSITEILLWRRPSRTILAILCGSILYYHAQFRLRPMIAFLADAFLILSCVSVGVYHLAAVAAPGWAVELSRKWEISTQSANCLVAFAVNLLGAAEAVLRVAASGSDIRLFLKVVVILYALSILGKLISGSTFLYACMWVGFTVPAICTRLWGDGTAVGAEIGGGGVMGAGGRVGGGSCGGVRSSGKGVGGGAGVGGSAASRFLSEGDVRSGDRGHSPVSSPTLAPAGASH